MSQTLTKTAQQSLGTRFDFAAACPETADAAGVAALAFDEMFDVFEGERPRLTATSEKRDTYGGPLYFAASEDIEVTEIKMPRKEGATPAEFDAAQTALKTSAEARGYGTLKITVPTSTGTRAQAFVVQVLSFHEELESPTGLQIVTVRLQAQKLQGLNAVGIDA